MSFTHTAVSESNVMAYLNISSTFLKSGYYI